MKLNTGAMLKAMGVGLVLELVLFGINQVATAAMGISPTADPQQMLATGGPLGIILCCVGLLVYGVLGAIYGWFAHRDQGIVDVGPAALGGGITAGVVSLVGSIVGTIYSVATGQMAATLEQAARQAGGELDAMMPVVIGGVVLGLCFSFALSAGFGAAGGAIYASTLGRGGQAQGTAPSI